MADSHELTIVITSEDDYSQAFAKLNNGLDTFDKKQKQSANSARESSRAMSDLNSVVNRLGGAFTIMGIAKVVGDLNELGVEARNAELTFTALAGGAEEAEAGLMQLRGATSGVVDDMTLMQGASQMLNTGLASNMTQASGMIEVATKLGAAFGNQGAAEAVSNFNLMLMNMSYARLDSLGISAGRVRERVNELKDAGMDAQAAFAQAVWEQGQESLERLGPAADQALTGLNMVGTGFENLKQEMAGIVSGAVETGAQLIVIGTDWGRDIIDGVRRGMQAAAGEGPDNGGPVPLGTAVNRETLDNRDFVNDVFADVDGMAEEFAARLGEAMELSIDEAYSLVDEAIDEISGRFEGGESLIDIQASIAPGPARNDLTIAILDQLIERENALPQIWRQQSLERFTALEREWATQREMQVSAQIAAEEQLALQSEINRLWAFQGEEVGYVLSDMNAMQDAAAGIWDGMGYADTGQAEELADLAEQAADEYERLSEIGVLPDGVLDRAELAADEIGRMASEAERTAEAFERITLSEIFGQTDGGLSGQVNDAVLEQLKAAGLSDEQIADYSEAYDLSAGRITESSMAFYDEMTPILAAAGQQFGPEMSALLNQAITDYLLEAAQNGESPTMEGMTGAANAAGFSWVGEGSGGAGITVQPGDSWWGLLGPDYASDPRYTGQPLHPGDFIGGSGYTFGYNPYGGGTVGGDQDFTPDRLAGGYENFIPEDAYVQPFESALSAVEELETGLMAFEGRAYELQFTVGVDDPYGLLVPMPERGHYNDRNGYEMGQYGAYDTLNEERKTDESYYPLWAQYPMGSGSGDISVLSEFEEAAKQSEIIATNVEFVGGIDMSSPVSNLNTELSLATESASGVDNTLKSIADTDYSTKLTVNIDVNDPRGVLSLLTGGVSLETLRKLIESNNGVTPGTNPNANQKNTGVM